METCTVETGLLKKKPCGHPMVTHCANCEQPLCKDHAVAQMSEAGQKTGKFMCKLCDAARRDFEKNTPAAPAPAKVAAPPPAPAAKAAAAAAPAPKPEEKKPEEKKGDDGSIDFTPSKK